MKKILYFTMLIVVSALIFGGCSQTTEDTLSDTAVSSDSTENSKDTAADNEKTFDDFVAYMTEGGFIKGSPVEMTANTIGASKGSRYSMGTNTTSKVYVELYEYEDTESDVASKILNEAKTSGTFTFYTSMESATQNTVAAVSDNGKFLMLYTDSSTSGTNVDTKNKAVEAVKNFGK
ncbi:MAG: hypothetical protein II685_03190 [Clostridia bacterium]|nr:hypothetical protein [Clostridia bacterium]